MFFFFFLFLFQICLSLFFLPLFFFGLLRGLLGFGFLLFLLFLGASYALFQVECSIVVVRSSCDSFGLGFFLSWLLIIGQELSLRGLLSIMLLLNLAFISGLLLVLLAMTGLWVGFSCLFLHHFEVLIRVFLLLFLMSIRALLELILLGGIFVLSVYLEINTLFFLSVLILISFKIFSYYTYIEVLFETTFVVIRFVSRLFLFGVEMRVGLKVDWLHYVMRKEIAQRTTLQFLLECVGWLSNLNEVVEEIRDR